MASLAWQQLCYPSFVSTQLHICRVFAWMHPVCINNWTWLGPCGPSPGTVPFFCIFAVNSVNLSPTMAHSFPKEKLKTVESQLSDASREQDPTCNGMARHGCVFGQCRPMILKGTGFDLKALYVPFLSISIHVSVLISLPDSSLPAPSSKSEQSTSITVSEQGGRQVHSILRRTRLKDCWKNLQRIHLQTQKLRWAECRFPCCTIVFSWNTNSGS